MAGMKRETEMRPNLIGKNEVVLRNYLRSTERDKKGIQLIPANQTFLIMKNAMSI